MSWGRYSSHEELPIMHNNVNECNAEPGSSEFPYVAAICDGEFASSFRTFDKAKSTAADAQLGRAASVAHRQAAPAETDAEQHDRPRQYRIASSRRLERPSGPRPETIAAQAGGIDAATGGLVPPIHVEHIRARRRQPVSPRLLLRTGRQCHSPPGRGRSDGPGGRCRRPFCLGRGWPLPPRSSLLCSSPPT